MSNMSCSEDGYAPFESTQSAHGYHAGSTHAIKLEYGTSYQSANRIPTSPFQRYGNHESSDAYVNNAYHYAQPTQLLHHSSEGPQFLPSHQMPQIFPSSQTCKLSILNQIHSIQIPQLPYPSIARILQPQPPYLEESSRSLEETPFYVNAKQFDRILKRRVERQRLEASSRSTIGIRKPYHYESRHRHAARRPRGPGGRFLPREELKRQEKAVQTRKTDRCQIAKTSTEPNRNHIKETNADLLAGMPTKDERGERREEARNGSHEKKSHGLEARKTSKTLSESQVHSKRSNYISKAMTTSFYGPAELERLHKRFPTMTAVDVPQMESY